MPLAKIENCFIGGMWPSLHPISIREFGRRLRRVDESKAILLNPTEFPLGARPVLEYGVFAPNRREQMIASLRLGLLERPQMDLLARREYPLDDHDKILVVSLYRYHDTPTRIEPDMLIYSRA